MGQNGLWGLLFMQKEFLVFSKSDLILSRKLIKPIRLTLKWHICPETSDYKNFKFTLSFLLGKEGEDIDIT